MGILFGTYRPPTFTRRQRWVDEHTQALREVTDYLWKDVFHQARADIDEAVAHGTPYVFIRLPFPFDREQNGWCNELACYWKKRGFSLRPGGPAGHVQDIIRLELDR